MRFNIFLFASLGVCLNVLTLYAQQEKTSYVPPSPNAAALAKHANIPVSLYTGTAKIEVPILALPSRQGSIPVSLSYHSSGIKVQDIASSSGLGWTLNSGGAITRVVRGLPDDDPQGYCGTNSRGNQVGNGLTKDYLKKVVGGEWDSEPDVFFFNFMGKTGRFILDENGNPVLTPYQDIDIQPAIGRNGKGFWTITDGDGTRYVFGKVWTEREMTSSKLSHQTWDKGKTFTSSWYLSEIRGADNMMVGTFTYTTGPAINYTYYRKVKGSIVGILVGNNHSTHSPSEGGVYDENIEIGLTSPKYIARISNTYGSIDFTYNTNRLDLTNGYSLKEVTLKKREGSQPETTLQSFSFSYGYFTSNDCQDNQLCKRLYLDKITRGFAGTALTYRQFGYASLNLPARNSSQIDHWGYYNNNPYVNSIPEQVYEGQTYEGANRAADASRSLANMLTSITNELQGTTRLVYGLHTYHDAATNSTKQAGGARIEQVIESSGASNSPDIITLYHYQKEQNPQQSSGVIFNIPVYSYEYSYILATVPTRRDFLRRHSQSLTDLFDINGAAVGYQTVTTVHAHGGTTISTFSNLANRPDTPPQQFEWNSGSGNTNTSPFSAPFTPNTSREWERGLLEEEKALDKNAVLQKKTLYHYAYNLSDRRVVSALRTIGRLLVLDQDINMDIYYVGRYNILSRPIYLTSIEEEVYDQQATNGVYHKTRTVTTFEYNAHLQLKKKVVGETGVDKQTITEYKYPTDYTFTTLSAEDDEMIMSIRTLFIRHIHNPIIEQTTSVKEVGQTEPEVVSSALKLYARVVTDSINAILPKEDKVFSLPQFSGAAPFEASTVQVVSGSNRFIFDGRYRTLQTLDVYNQTGKLSQVTEKNTLTTSYVWSSQNALPIAEVKSARLIPRSENYPVTKSSRLLFYRAVGDARPIEEQLDQIPLHTAQTVTFTVRVDHNSNTLSSYVLLTLIDGTTGTAIFQNTIAASDGTVTINRALSSGGYYLSCRTYPRDTDNDNVSPGEMEVIMRIKSWTSFSKP